MEADDIYWMNYSINVANTNKLKVKHNFLRVGAVLVSKSNELICFSYTNETMNFSWYESLLIKIQNSNIKEAEKLFLTINTIYNNSKFDLNELLKKIKISKIYIGVPDPNLNFYLNEDPCIYEEHVYRFQEDLQKLIINQNRSYFKNSKQNINNSPYYSEKRITNLVLQNLKKNGFEITDNELNNNKSFEKLSLFLTNKFKITDKNSQNITKKVLSEAFNEKYSSYDYINDTRSIDVNWEEKFKLIYHKLTDIPINRRKIIDVGVGGGNEAISLFYNCNNITFVDIADEGLKRIKNKMPFVNIIKNRAEDLRDVKSDYYDTYISLRTYNSSFFDIDNALKEAFRVIQMNAIIIISIANGFLYQTEKTIIPGLLIPGTEFVDIYRGISLAKYIQNKMNNLGFMNIKIYPTNEEIYIVANKNK